MGKKKPVKKPPSKAKPGKAKPDAKCRDKKNRSQRAATWTLFEMFVKSIRDLVQAFSRDHKELDALLQTYEAFLISQRRYYEEFVFDCRRDRSSQAELADKALISLHKLIQSTFNAERFTPLDALQKVELWGLGLTLEKELCDCLAPRSEAPTGRKTTTNIDIAIGCLATVYAVQAVGGDRHELRDALAVNGVRRDGFIRSIPIMQKQLRTYRAHAKKRYLS